MRDLLEFFLVLRYILAFIGVFMLGGWFIAVHWDKTTCTNVAARMHFNSDYGVTQGCMIEYEKDKWIEINHYRVEGK